ncbi:hypothetical protein B6D60_06775 [candidate division KSB1 bacterium 4484_87]|nr:MAG: hypothetical protein B6D60_06775 [candidate division KSB1 bacterium 4484_87]
MKNRKIVRLPGIVAYLLLITFQVFGQGKNQIRNNNQSVLKAQFTIHAANCESYVEKLASDEFAGRGTYTTGFYKTANYIARHFHEIGLQPAINDTSYFQRFTVDPNVLAAHNILELKIPVSTKTGTDTLTLSYQEEKDFLPFGFSASIDRTLPVVFAGYGITSPKNNWDDYANLDVKGKIVLVLGGRPQLKDAHWKYESRSRNKAKNARKHGAAALLIIGSPIGTVSYRQSVPGMFIAKSVAENLLKGSDFTIEQLTDTMNKTQQPLSLQLKFPIRIKISAEHKKQQSTMNIVGYLPGSDPKLKNEYIVIGAHADHLGQLGDLIFHGANDNASGTATVMEIARAFSSLPKKPRRSLVFITFAGEEMGLLGSKYYTAHPIFPLKKTKAMINLDMVGSGWEGVMIVGGFTFPEFADLFNHHHELIGYGNVLRRWTSNNSDHYPFHEHGVPSVFLYSPTSLPTYHTTGDKPETLDPEVMEAIGRLVFRVAYDLANQDQIHFKKVEQ